MIYTSIYKSPIGQILIGTKDNKLVGVWIENQKYYLSDFKEKVERVDNYNNESITKTKKWLDRYFDDKKPEISELELDPIGSEFRKNVWKLLCKIPYGKITTYKSIAENVAKIMNRKQMSAQAIGGAVGHNPISIIIPCHRVIGTDGSLTGYAGGIDKKIKLLKLEKVDLKDIKV